MSAAAFRALLEAGDIGALRAAWAKVAPHLPQPQTRDEAEMVMHHARTTAASISFKAAAYSHRWLTERGFPSGLPDELRPKAERMYPVIAEGVGVSLNTKNEYLKPALVEVRQSMEDAINDAYAEKRTEPGFVKQRMEEARARTWRALFGR